jgi:hypothetical protein
MGNNRGGAEELERQADAIRSEAETFVPQIDLTNDDIESEFKLSAGS